MKRILMICVSAAVLPAPALAQLPGLDVILTPRVGAYSAMGRLTDTPTTETKIKSALGYGLSIELDLPASPYDLRASFNVVTGADVEHQGNGSILGDADIINLTGDVVFRPIPRVGVQPYLLAGAGIKKYSFGGNFDPGGEEDITDFTGHIGGGIDLRLGPLGALVEISDYISSFKPAVASKIQHDVFLLAGVRIGIL